MTEKKKAPTPAPEKREISLTELAERNRTLGIALAEHTAARNYLWSIVTGGGVLPMLVLKPMFDSAPGDVLATEQSAEVDMNRFPQEAAETIMLMVIEHEEKLAFDAWKEIANNAAQACGVITRVQLQREEELQKQAAAQQEELPQTIPLQQRDQNVESQEVPRSWPGRVSNQPPSQ